MAIRGETMTEGEQLIGKTFEMAQTLCEEEDILWDGYYIKSIRVCQVNKLLLIQHGKERRVNNRLNVSMVDGKITELLFRG